VAVKSGPPGRLRPGAAQARAGCGRKDDGHGGELGRRRGQTCQPRPTAATPSPTGTTPASVRAAGPRISRPAMRPPSPARRRFNRRKILRGGGDAAGPARGLRASGHRSRHQQRDCKRERDFAHAVCLSRSVASPAVSAPRRYLDTIPVGSANRDIRVFPTWNRNASGPECWRYLRPRPLQNATQS
jgi:hypothetical protein